jgi:predicted permease
MLEEAFVKTANRFVFNVALPVMVFEDLWQADISGAFDWKFVLFCFFATVICFFVIWGGAELFLKDKTQIGAFVQGSFRSSAAVLGLAFIKNIYGDAGMAPLMIIGAVPFYNVASVVVLTFRGKEQNYANGKEGIRKACINIVKNPIIIGILLGCLASLIDLKLPVMATKTLDLVERTATPLALLAIGAGFTFTSAKERKKPAIWGTAIKLVLQAVVVVPIAVAMGFRNQEMLAILIMIASPATPSGYIMAKEMNNDAVLSSCIIVLSTLVSAFTLTAWIYLLKTLGVLS